MQPRRCSRPHGSAICQQFELFVKRWWHLESVLMMMLMMMVMMMISISISISRNMRCVGAMQLQLRVFLPWLLVPT